MFIPDGWSIADFGITVGVWVIVAISGLPMLWLSEKQGIETNDKKVARVLGITGCWLFPLTLLAHIAFSEAACSIRNNRLMREALATPMGEGGIGGVAYPATCHGVDWALPHSMLLTLMVMLIFISFFGRQARLGRAARWACAVMGFLSLLPIVYVSIMIFGNFW